LPAEGCDEVGVVGVGFDGPVASREVRHLGVGSCSARDDVERERDVE
jgi:hypothetical protein